MTPLQIDQIKTESKNVFDTLRDTVDYLAARWLDECEYEDIGEYAEAIKKKLPPSAKFLKINKRPFGFDFVVPSGYVFRMYATGRTVGLKGIRKHTSQWD
jgi:hypothetical protein